MVRNCFFQLENVGDLSFIPDLHLITGVHILFYRKVDFCNVLRVGLSLQTAGVAYSVAG